MFPRWQAQPVLEARQQRRVILLEGARQVGKTTLARQLTDEQVLYRTLDDIAIREAANRDPKGFLQHDAEMMIIDEIQHAPDLLPEIKRLVDLDTRPGQFLLTGSARLHDLPQVQESLAGRIARLRLRPLSQGEMAGQPPDFFERVLADEIGSSDPDFSKQDFLRRAMIGGYAEPGSLSHRGRRRWHRDYIDAILSRDLLDIANIRKIEALRQLVEVTAAWSSKLIDITEIGRGLAINRATIESYLAALRTVFLIDRLLPWTRTDYARVGKKDRLFVTDPGLMAGLLGYPEDQTRLSDDHTGKLAECLVHSELMALANASDGRFSVYHYRDGEQREIDFLIEDEEGGFIGIEVKAGLTVRAGDFRHMRWFRENLAGSRPFTGVILYAGTDVLPFGDGMIVAPASALWRA